MADRLARREVKLVFVVVDGLRPLVSVRMPAVRLVVGASRAARVVGVLVQTVVLVVVLLGWDGVEVVRVERRCFAICLPALVLHHYVAVLPGDLAFALRPELGTAGLLLLVLRLVLPIFFPVRVRAAEVVEIADIQLLLLSRVRDLAMALVSHMCLHGIRVRLHLAASETFI